MKAEGGRRVGNQQSFTKRTMEWLLDLLYSWVGFNKVEVVLAAR